MNNIQIRPITGLEWEVFKKLRLKALRTNPSSFGEAIEDAKTKTDDTWKKQAEESEQKKDQETLIAYSDDKAIGMIFVFLRENPEEGGVGGFWIDPEYRRKGVGKILFQSALNWLKEKSIREVNFWNNPDNKASSAFYEKMGFEYTGKAKELESNSEQSIQLMRKALL